jgi:hypothetical protein
MSQGNFKIDLKSVVKIPITADGAECLGDLKVSWEKCLEAAGGDEVLAELIYEGATNDGLPGYNVPVQLLK